MEIPENRWDMISQYKNALKKLPIAYRLDSGQLLSEYDFLSRYGFALTPDKPLNEQIHTEEEANAIYDVLMRVRYKIQTPGGGWRMDNHTLTSALKALFNTTVERGKVAGASQKMIVKTNRNQIYFGAPGTGKSYALNEEAKKAFRGNVERVTFYADYLHSQFVGSYKPVMDSNGKDIKYEFQPGPFARILVKALEHADTPYCLIIEELNRAEAASVFGDLFQLLDRDSNGASQYPVSVSEDFKKYLEDNLNSQGKNNLESLVKEALGSNDVPNGSCGMIVIPSNMYIWATMNSADQGVFPLDTAFKRRWNFQYFPLDEGKKKLHTENDKYWNRIREAINAKLIELGVNEDKCMGPFFLNEEERNNDFDEAFKNKVIMYLFEDAAKYHKELFAQQNMTLSGLFTAWGNDKKSVFCEDVAKVISNVSSSQQKSDGKAAPDKSNEQPGGENEDAPSADSANPEPAQDGNDD